MKTFKRIFFISIILFVCSCSQLNWLYGVDDKGNDTPGIPPIDMFMEIVKQMGPIGTLVSAGLTIGGTVYVAHKRGKAKGDDKVEVAEGMAKAVIKGIQEVRDELPEKQEKALVKKLKKKIPNEWHPAIDAIRDRL